MAKRAPIIRAFLGADEIVVDNFAGGGGASSGVGRAIGRSPDIAINHDPEAIAMHKANHPETKHYLESVWDVDPVEACAGRAVALAWFSPTCTHFSKAKGTALDANSIKIRGLAWVTVRWAQKVAPRIICLENVEEFEKWGPLHRQHTDGCAGVACGAGCRFGTKPKNRRSKGRIKRHDLDCPGVVCQDGCRIHKPIKSREGETFQAFVAKLRRLGYVVEWRQLRACDYGAPTTRKRLFMVARRDGIAIVWPDATHGPKREAPHQAAAGCIDWNIPCPSIFERDRPLADKTLARIARGIKKFVLENPRPFIVPPAYGDKGGTDVRVNDINEPMRTICGNRGGHSIVTPMFIKAKSYGGGGNDAMSVEDPLRTILASKRGEFAAVETTLVRVGETVDGQEASEHAAQLDLFQRSATLVRTAHGDVDKTGKRRGLGAHDVEKPFPTVCTTGSDYAIAVPYLVHRSNGERPGQAPRIYDVQKPLGTIVGTEKHAACVALLIKNNGGNNDAHGSSGQPVDRPMDTISGRDSKSVTVAHLVRYNSENSEGSARGQDVEIPMSTLDTANRFGLVASHLVKLRGTSEAHLDSSASSMEEPVPTISASGTHVAAVAAFLVRYNGKSEAQTVDSPIGTLDTTDRYGLITVTIDGEDYVIADIGMRMLTPRELYRAQGFDEGYKIDPVHNGKKLTKTAQIRMVGNSVPPIMAEVIARAQLAAKPPVRATSARAA